MPSLGLEIILSKAESVLNYRAGCRTYTTVSHDSITRVTKVEVEQDSALCCLKAVLQFTCQSDGYSSLHVEHSVFSNTFMELH